MVMASSLDRMDSFTPPLAVLGRGFASDTPGMASAALQWQPRVVNNEVWQTRRTEPHRDATRRRTSRGRGQLLNPTCAARRRATWNGVVLTNHSGRDPVASVGSLGLTRGCMHRRSQLRAANMPHTDHRLHLPAVRTYRLHQNSSLRTPSATTTRLGLG